MSCQLSGKVLVTQMAEKGHSPGDAEIDRVALDQRSVSAVPGESEMSVMKMGDRPDQIVRAIEQVERSSRDDVPLGRRARSSGGKECFWSARRSDQHARAIDLKIVDHYLSHVGRQRDDEVRSAQIPRGDPVQQGSSRVPENVASCGHLHQRPA